MYTPEDLRKALEEIFADSYVDTEERVRLREFQGKLSDEATLEVFRGFLNDKWGEAIADGVVTEQEKRLLAHILEELALQLTHLPEQAQLALKDHI